MAGSISTLGLQLAAELAAEEITVLVSALLLLAAAPTAAPAVAEPKPSDMSAAEIRAFNKTVDKKHPYYIKCVREADTGSLVGRKPVCRTNERWALLEKQTRNATADLARDMVGQSASSASN